MASKFQEPWVWYWAGVLWHSREANQDALQDQAARTIFAYLGNLENPVIEKPLQLVQDLDEPNSKEVTQAVWALARFYVAAGQGSEPLPESSAPTMGLEVTANGIRKIRKTKTRANAARRSWIDKDPNGPPF